MCKTAEDFNRIIFEIRNKETGGGGGVEITAA